MEAVAESLASPLSLVVFDTHPIQYRSPVFRALARRVLGFKVFYFDETFDGNKWWFHEKGKIPPQKWELKLTDGFENDCLHAKRLGLYQFYRQVKTLFETERPRAAVIYGYYLPEHWVIRFLAARYSIKLIFVGETLARKSTFARRLIKRLLQPWFFRGIASVVSIGEKSRDYYRDLKIPSGRILAAKYCVDTEFFRLEKFASVGARERIRAAWGISEDAFVILFVGRLFERKRPQDVIAIHRRLRESNPKLATIIVGNGPMEAELKSLASGEPNIFFAGFKNQAETRDYYHAANLLLVPSEYETWGLVVNEAFTAGLPAVVTETCGSADDLVMAGETGFIYPVGNTEQASLLIRVAIANPHYYQSLRDRAFRKVTKEYQVEQFANVLAAAIK